MAEAPLNRSGRRKMASLERHGNTRRQFSYVMGKPGDKGYAKLDFTLRIDIKDELRAFLEMLDAARADVQQELDNPIRIV